MTDARLLDPPLLPLWRAPGVLQLGVDGRVVLDQVPTGLAHAITLLHHPQTRKSLGHLLPSLDSAWIDWLWAELTRHGALRPASHVRSEVAVVGSGELASQLAAALTEADRGNVVHLTRGTEGALVPGHALRRTWTTQPTLAILATQTAEPDRTLTDELVRATIPHLVVRMEPNRAVVGPFVIPGTTGCVRCFDLSRSQYDTVWPRLLAQLCRATPRAPAALQGWAVATAIVQVRAHLTGNEPDALGRILEVRSDDPSLHSLDISAHPDCPCQNTLQDD